ncbi:MAG: tetraacyldisaccharide 4'-kinase [Marinilabiliales bacterium]|nr:MAG: tetraacyldisaccharide 4'-kinase [Marinilabiliales bacterium]
MVTWKFILFPFALAYGLAIRIRNWLFNVGILKEKEFQIPTIGVGNLVVGGTGKTPFTEYLVRLLQHDYKIATLSRGYGRSTTGFRLVDQFSDHEDVGDEPLQYSRKFGNKITVSVDESRRNGIRFLMQNDQSLDVILLDDCFQHRYVKPGITILLTEYHNLFVEDYFLPVGRLRDSISSAKRADIIIVTKTYKVLSPITRRRIDDLLKPEPHQKIYYSYLNYGDLVPLPGTKEEIPSKKATTIVMFSGVANPEPFKDFLRDQCSELICHDFPDHHIFKKKDLQMIREKFTDLFTRSKIIVTTEKDAMRLLKSPYLSEFKDLPVFYIPIEVKLHGTDESEFANQIFKYVEENRRNS